METRNQYYGNHISNLENVCDNLQIKLLQAQDATDKKFTTFNE